MKNIKIVSLNQVIYYNIFLPHTQVVSICADRFDVNCKHF